MVPIWNKKTQMIVSGKPFYYTKNAIIIFPHHKPCFVYNQLISQCRDNPHTPVIRRLHSMGFSIIRKTS